jgi:glutamate synthase (NADPH/NADH) small chain
MPSRFWSRTGVGPTAWFASSGADEKEQQVNVAVHGHEGGHEGVCAGRPGNLFSILNAPDQRLNLIADKQTLCENTRSFVLHCPGVARFCEPGQFVVVRGEEHGERIPLTIADFDRDAGTITLVVQIIGVGTRKLDELIVGDRFLDVVGPLGHASEIRNFGCVALVGGGLGVAPVYPIQRALKAAGSRVVSVIGARTKSLVFWEDRMRATADELIVMTDDGTYGERGLVTAPLRRLIEAGQKIDRVVAIGPALMMRAVAEATRAAKIPTIVSLNTVMVDGTGMCGGCRVEVGKDVKFTCVDGPEFDAHAINFDLLLSRLGTYREEEARALQHFEKRRAERRPVKAKGRTAMPEQDPQIRRGNFNEVALGYTMELAQSEALRCLQCRKAACIAGCPVNIDIPAFIKNIAEGRFAASVRKLRETNNLPAICGRVCPQETQCEQLCILGKKSEPIAIGRLERFAADWEAAQGKAAVPELAEATGRRAAVVGAGPAGLTAAADLALRGHKVTVFEALHSPGGVLVYGIPEFRLPKAIVHRECQFLEELGVEFKCSMPIGGGLSVPLLLREGFDVAFIAVGAGLPYFMGIPGENLKGVYSSNEFLTRVNLMKAYRFPEYETPVLVGRNVAVVGGGNVAMDAARSALRLGAENVYIVYRRTRKEMPAREEEVHHAVDEGVELRELTNPVQVLGDAEGWVCGLECSLMELGEPDASGRRRPIPIPDSLHVLEIDQMIMAIGNGPNPMLTRSWPELKLDKRGNIAVDENLMTNIPGVFAGGDIVTGAATVIEAMGAGKKAAKAMDAWLKVHAHTPA